MFNSGKKGLMFRPAAELKSYLRLAFVGVSGSGKTYSSLALAQELAGEGGKIAVVDTENGSSTKYSDLFDFDVLTLDNYHPRHYMEAIDAAVEYGYKVIVLDSLSHAWSGHGGLLEEVDNVAVRKKNNFTAWAEVTPIHRQMIEKILGADIHVIATLRAKTEYIVEDVNGKKVPRKVGLAPDQRAGLEYEFDIVGDLDADGKLAISKTRLASINERVYRRPNAEFYETVSAWANRTNIATPAQRELYDQLRADYEFAGLGKLAAPKANATAAQLDYAIKRAQHLLSKAESEAAALAEPEPKAAPEPKQSKPAAKPKPKPQPKKKPSQYGALAKECGNLARQLWDADWRVKLDVFAEKPAETLIEAELAETVKHLRALAARAAEKDDIEEHEQYWEDEGNNDATNEPEPSAAKPVAPKNQPRTPRAKAQKANKQPQPTKPPQTAKSGGKNHGAKGRQKEKLVKGTPEAEAEPTLLVPPKVGAAPANAYGMD